MRGPIRHYVLAYEGDIASQGTSPPYPQAECATTSEGTSLNSVITKRQSTNLHYRLTWQVIFGRYHRHVALVYRAHTRAGSGYETITTDTTAPPGCPPLDGGDRHVACAGSLPLGHLLFSVSPRRFGIFSDELFGQRWRPSCTSGSADDPDFVFPIVLPRKAQLTYTKAGIARRKTFVGKVSTTLDGTITAPSDRNDVQLSFILKPGRS